MRRRMCASRRASNAIGQRCPARTAAIASATASNTGLAVAAVLDEVLPPALGVGLAGGRGEGAERVERRPGAVEQIGVVVDRRPG